MEELGSPRELQIKESELSERITSLEKKIHYSNIEEVTTIAYIAFLREFYKLSQSFCMWLYFINLLGLLLQSTNVVIIEWVYLRT